ncbi:MAG: hypothetical protein H6673_00075 [Anaerolineales bacterium]|nr:hypothetical protein [Anaerolineales bacterium]
MNEEQIITPDEAEDLLRPEVEQLVAEGWRITSKPLYGVRLERERDILDLRVDLLGNIIREQKVNMFSGADTGRLVAWVLLIVSLLVALTLASVLGLLD